MRSRISALALIAALTAAAPALATFHLIKVKEVFPGTVASPNAQYVMLQSYAAGQNMLTGHAIHVFDAHGVEITSFAFANSVANSASQMTVLIATAEAKTLFGFSTVDLTMTAALALTGGKVCYETLDCVSWGSYSGGAIGTGVPFNAPVGLEQGRAMQRRLDIAGSPTVLDAADDTNDSANDFLFMTPAPMNNAGTAGTLPSSVCGNLVIEGLEGCDDGNNTDGDGCSAVCRPEPASVAAAALLVDDAASTPPLNNGILEPGETVILAPSWTNNGLSALDLTGTAAAFTGPAGAVYTIADAAADYGSVAAAGTASCATGADCYSLTVSAPATRPATHWDATLTEVLSNNAFANWTLHVGNSFPDVPHNIFYPFIENLFHNGVTGGCAGGGYCPGNDVTRAQMAVFLLKSKFGSDYQPPPATGTVFTDVPASNPFAPWIENLFALGITGGCGTGIYCPDNSVTRQQMAVFLLKTKNGSAYTPPDGVGLFADVTPCPGVVCNFIEELYNETITGGCQTVPTLLYCPGNPNLRQQMAVFLVKTFALQLYGN